MRSRARSANIWSAAFAALQTARGNRVVCVLAAILALTVPRRAAPQLVVDQVDLVFERQPGSAVRQTFTVTNKGRAAAQASLSVEDWDRDSVGNNHFYPLGTHEPSCGRAFAVDPASVRLDSGATQQVRVSVDTTTLTRGECWAVAFVTTAIPSSRTSGRRVNFVMRTGVKLYVVPPGATRNGEVVAMRVRPHERPVRRDSLLLKTSESDPGRMVAAPRLTSTDSAVAADTTKQELVLTFANTGTRHHVAHGSVEIRRPDNTTAARLAMPNVYTLPGASEVIVVPLPNLTRGTYVALAILDFGGDQLAAAQVEYAVP